MRPGAQLVVRTVLNAGAVKDGEGISVGEDQFYALRRQGKGPYFSDRLVAAPDDAAVALLRKTACQLVVAAVGDDGVLPAQGGEFVILPNLVNYIAYRGDSRSQARRDADDVAVSSQQGNAQAVGEDGRHVCRRDVKDEAPSKAGFLLGKMQAQLLEVIGPQPEAKCTPGGFGPGYGMMTQLVRQYGKKIQYDRGEGLHREWFFRYRAG